MQGVTSVATKKGPLGLPLFVVIAAIVVVIVVILAVVLVALPGSGSGESSPENAIRSYYSALTKENANDAMKVTTINFASETVKNSMRNMWSGYFAANDRFSLSNVEVMSDAAVEDEYGETIENLDNEVKDLVSNQGVTKSISEVAFVQFHYDLTYDGGSNSNTQIQPVCKIDGKWYAYAFLTTGSIMIQGTLGS